MKGFSFQALVRAFTEQYQVGDLFLSLNAANPASHLGGTWALLSGTASLSIGNGTNLDGVSIVGKDVLTAPLPQHSHTEAAHNHTFSTTVDASLGHTHSASGGTIGEAAAHFHNRGTMEIEGTFRADDRTTGTGGGPLPTGAFASSVPESVSGGAEGRDGTRSHMKFKASDAWTGNTSSNGAHSHSLEGLTIAAGGAHSHAVSGSTSTDAPHSTSLVGTANPTLNTAGARLPVNVWKKTAM